MDIVTFLPPPLFTHARNVLGHGHVLTKAKGWEHLSHLVRTTPTDVILADPAADGIIRVDELQDLIARFSSLPVIVYSSVTPESLKATVVLAHGGARLVLLHGFDDDPEHFKRVIEKEPAYTLGDRLLERLSQPLRKVPLSISGAIATLVGSPLRFKGIDDLAQAAGTSRRTLSRSMAKAGLAEASIFLIGAKLVRAYHYMRDPGYKLEDISAKMGYGLPRHFARQVRLGLGMTPSVLRRTLGPDEFITQLAARLCRRGG